MIKATYVDHMGSDLSVVNAARVSFGKTSEMEENTWGPPTLKSKDAKLISYLAKHKHISRRAIINTQLESYCRSELPYIQASNQPIGSLQ